MLGKQAGASCRMMAAAAAGRPCAGRQGGLYQETKRMQACKGGGGGLLILQMPMCNECMCLYGIFVVCIACTARLPGHPSSLSSSSSCYLFFVLQVKVCYDRPPAGNRTCRLDTAQYQVWAVLGLTVGAKLIQDIPHKDRTRAAAANRRLDPYKV